MIKIAVIDDDKQCAEQTGHFVRRFYNNDDSAYRISFFTNGLDFINEYRAVYDVIFLDIDMPLMDGIETAKKLRQQDDQVLLIYMTRMAQYAAWGYEVDAIGFLVKPIDYYSFEMKMKKAERILRERRTVSIIVPTDSGKRVISSKKLKYIEVMGHEVLLHTEEGVYRCWGTLKEYCERLSQAAFVQVSRYHLVNLEWVHAIDNGTIIVDNDRISVSRSRKKQFMENLTEFYGNR